MTSPTVQVTFRWPPALHRKVAQVAKREGMTVNAYVQQLVEKEIKR